MCAWVNVDTYTHSISIHTNIYSIYTQMYKHIHTTSTQICKHTNSLQSYTQVCKHIYAQYIHKHALMHPTSKHKYENTHTFTTSTYMRVNIYIHTYTHYVHKLRKRIYSLPPIQTRTHTHYIQTYKYANTQELKEPQGSISMLFSIFYFNFILYV